jgi:glycosyltransferase involved in cell wall biosynthesis
MRVAVNARFLLPNRIEGIGGFTFEVARRLARDHPDDELLLFFDRPYDRRFVCGDNIRPVVLTPPTRHPLLCLFWFELAVARALRLHQPDVFLSADGCMSLRADVPTLLVAHDVAFERYSEGIDRVQRLYYTTLTPRWLRKAAAIATVSEFSKRELAEVYGTDPDRIQVVYNGVGEAFRPADEASQAQTRARYAGGADYVLHVGAIHPRKNVANLLRAFDLVRRRSARPLKLLLAGRLAWKYDDVLRAHAGMGCRDDVVFLGYVPPDDLPAVVAAARAVAYLSFYEGFGMPVTEAMACGVPVVASNCGAIPEIAGDAALYVEPNDVRAIAAAIERLLVDAALRRDCVARGINRAARFNWDVTAAAIWSQLRRVADSRNSQRRRPQTP